MESLRRNRHPRRRRTARPWGRPKTRWSFPTKGCSSSLTASSWRRKWERSKQRSPASWTNPWGLSSGRIDSDESCPNSFSESISRGISSVARMSHSCRTHDGPSDDACPMSRSGTWSPTSRSKSSVRTIRPTRCKSRASSTFERACRASGSSTPGSAEVHVYTSPTQVQILTADQELDGGDLLPGFRLPLASLFDDDPEVD